MTNRDMFNQISNDELAIILSHNLSGERCKFCIHTGHTCWSCVNGIKAWLYAPCEGEQKIHLLSKMDLAKGIAEDVVDMLENMLVKKHKTVPRQKLGADSKEDIESLKELFKGAEIMNPVDWEILDVPALGAKTYMVVFNDVNELVILENKFMVSDIELWMLAQGRLFTDRWSAEMYLKKCKGVISAIKAQLQVLTKEDSL